MELWDIYDIDRNKTDKRIKRGDKLSKNEFHLVVHICIFNSEGKMLVQQRQPFKDGWPNMWDITAGGSAIVGETSGMAAERELFEEIGYKADLLNKRPFFTINFEAGFDDYYIIESNVDINELKLQYEEVQKVKWATKEEILRMITEGSFIPYYSSIIEMLFEKRGHYSAHKNETAR